MLEGKKPPRVLVADDDPSALRGVAEILRAHGMDVVTVESGRKGVDLALGGGFDLVLLDVVMPDLGGLECCRLIKAKTAESFLPVVLVTVRNSPDHRVEGLRMGADDYVGKPFDERELIERVSALLRIKRLHDELHQARIELEKLATHDDLTGLYNYRYLRTRLDDEFKRSKRYRTPLSCLMVDVDRFKSINDEHGHEIGNAVLQELATRMTDTMREVDVVARYGGEEFVLLLPETGGPQGVMAAERLRLAVGGRMFQVEGRTIAATISAGVSYYPAPNLETRDDLLRAADRALYRAKRAGRDRVCFVGDEAD